MSNLLSALVAVGLALGLNAASAQNADPYKQRDTSGAAQDQTQAMKEKMKECRKLSGQAKQDCIKDIEANQGQSTGAGGAQQEPQSGQAPSSDQTKRRQQ